MLVVISRHSSQRHHGKERMVGPRDEEYATKEDFLIALAEWFLK